MLLLPMQTLPSDIYTVAQVVQLEQLAIQQYGIPGYTLMRRAGQAVVDFIQTSFTRDTPLLVLCGAGNNAGDGYVIARLAKQAGYPVTVVGLVETEKLKGDAQLAARHWLECGEVQLFDPALLETATVIVDALLGTGLDREVSGEWAAIIDAVNRASSASEKSVIAVDVPSGLKADTGAIAGIAVQADATVTFVGVKTGLLTGAGPDCCGRIHFHDLNVPAEIFQKIKPGVCLNDRPPPLLPPRSPTAHKGLFGHALVVGGNDSMAGAVILAGKAALRAGAGLVSVFTRVQHVSAINAACPELMVASNDVSAMPLPSDLLQKVTHIAVGPGLGRDEWAQACLVQCLAAGKPLVLDADALNLLVEMEPVINSDCILTPHPGEAARLLQTTTAEIAGDRYAAIRALQQRFASEYPLAVILKGTGSLVYDGDVLSVCPRGNAAMATAGMGDVLTGITLAMLAQGADVQQAAETAVLAHALAGDKAARGLSRGILASDVIDVVATFL